MNKYVIVSASILCSISLVSFGFVGERTYVGLHKRLPKQVRHLNPHIKTGINVVTPLAAAGLIHRSQVNPEGNLVRKTAKDQGTSTFNTKHAQTFYNYTKTGLVLYSAGSAISHFHPKAGSVISRVGVCLPATALVGNGLDQFSDYLTTQMGKEPLINAKTTAFKLLTFVTLYTGAELLEDYIFGETEEN